MTTKKKKAIIKKKALSASDIFKVEDLITEEVEVPEWDGMVLVRALTGKERDEYEASLVERKGDQIIFKKENVRARLVAKCVVDEDGERLFKDSQIEALGKKNAAPLDRIYDVCTRLSGIGPSSMADFEKN